MTFRIRQIEQTATGREIVRDRDIAGETLSIGRSAECDIHLPDLAVEPRHAEVSAVSGARLRVEAVGTLGFVVDGAETRSASIDSLGGAELGFGTYRITVSQDEDGAVLLTVRKAETAATRSGNLEEKRGFSLGGVLPGKRRMSWALAIVIVLAFLALPIVTNIMSVKGPRAADKSSVINDGSWNPGELSLAHHSLTDKCVACHVKPFESVRDETCRSCHKDVHDHAPEARLAAARGNLPLGQAALWKVAHAFGKEGPGACQDCHSEHKGPTRLTAPSQQFCADCHGQLKSNLPDTRLGDAGDFGKLHPQFTARVITDPVTRHPSFVSLDSKLREDNGLTFPHKLHLDPMGGAARMARNIGAERGYGSNGLECKDCHRKTEEGVRFKPIDMERDCEGCHSLAYERVGGIVRRLRHGDVEQLTADLLAAKWDHSKPLVSNRKRPGEYAEGGLYQFRYSGGAWPGLQLDVALSKDGICGECHRPTRINGRPGVVPVSQPMRYFDHGWFDHAAHKQEKCTTCHAAETSTSASDVLLPGIKTCRTCHLGEDAPKSKVPSSCAMCHGYHITETGSADRKPDVNLSSPKKVALRRE
ncbi:cytochrome c3 family protein [Novosphingobium pentaromativorans]|uniref:Cytochrome c family protein n=1 Tax=Novosphingobium pentaromativorans US6-1 TaxID=1088721 RepID=G6EA71_9SPHN|nr:cytochrome c3 family protein [Novosphingobium pentaromativorans]AIT80788.1 cytochrome C [Novosphingobium pentaromativorans US6-1]EHJ61786.1 Cytochrome c family protein [Novosphingobium pentaromativorans US6-1]